MSRSFSLLSLALLVVPLMAPACGSKTADQIDKFADKVCRCQDAACAKGVEDEFLAWREANKRSRGSASERKSVEKALQRYAECHDKLVVEEPAAALPGPSPAPTATPTPMPAAPAESAAPAAPAANAEE